MTVLVTVSVTVAEHAAVAVSADTGTDTDTNTEAVTVSVIVTKEMVTVGDEDEVGKLSASVKNACTLSSEVTVDEIVTGEDKISPQNTVVVVFGILCESTGSSTTGAGPFERTTMVPVSFNRQRLRMAAALSTVSACVREKKRRSQRRQRVMMVCSILECCCCVLCSKVGRVGFSLECL